MHHIRANIKTSIKELNLRNNSKDIFIDVLDGSKQIEILSNFPHPDISALKFWLNSNKSFKVKVAIAESNLSFSESTDLVILYQLPNQLNNAREIIMKAKASGKSILFFLVPRQITMPSITLRNLITFRSKAISYKTTLQS